MCIPAISDITNKDNKYIPFNAQYVYLRFFLIITMIYRKSWIKLSIRIIQKFNTYYLETQQSYRNGHKSKLQIRHLVGNEQMTLVAKWLFINRPVYSCSEIKFCKANVMNTCWNYV